MTYNYIFDYFIEDASTIFRRIRFFEKVKELKNSPIDIRKRKHRQFFSIFHSRKRKQHKGYKGLISLFPTKI